MSFTKIFVSHWINESTKSLRITNFIFTHQNSDSCSQGLDYRLEEFNKKFKKYLHALFHNFEDWVTVYSNTPGTQRENREVFGPDYL